MYWRICFPFNAYDCFLCAFLVHLIISVSSLDNNNFNDKIKVLKLLWRSGVIL